MFRVLVLAASSAAAASSAISSLLFQISDASQIYGSTSISRQAEGGPTFAIGTDFGSAQYALVNSTASGGPSFRLTPSASCGSSCSLFVDQARHAGAAAGAPAVDTFVLQVGDGACTVSGYYSAGPLATGTAAWTTTVPKCDASEGVGGAYRCFQASDDGRLVALQATGMDTGLPNATARAYAFDGQTGAINWTFDLKGDPAGQGDITITGDGAWVGFVNEDSEPCPNCAQLHVINGATGALRALVQIPFFIAAGISQDASFAVIQNFTHLQGSEPWVMAWNASTAAYSLLHRLELPSDGFEYDLWDIAVTDTPGGPVAVLGWIQAGTVQRLRVNAWQCDTGALLMDWAAPPNTDTGLQNNPTIRTYGSYIALALWGDKGNAPTVELLTTASNTSLFSFVSPGSMMAVDVVVDASVPAQDIVYLTAGGKSVPANEFGSGGDAYVWQVTVDKAAAAE